METIRITGPGSAATFALPPFSLRKRGYVRAVRLYSTVATTDGAGDLWTFALVNRTSTEDVASRATFAAAAADDVAANTEYALTVDGAQKQVNTGDVLALDATLTGGGTNLAAALVTVEVDIV